MSHDLSSLDSTVALLGDDSVEITEEHARVASEAMAALPPEAFQEGAKRLASVGTAAMHQRRLQRLNVLMAAQPAWKHACAAHAERRAAAEKSTP